MMTQAPTPATVRDPSLPPRGATAISSSALFGPSPGRAIDAISRGISTSVSTAYDVTRDITMGAVDVTRGTVMAVVRALDTGFGNRTGVSVRKIFMERFGIGSAAAAGLPGVEDEADDESDEDMPTDPAARRQRIDMMRDQLLEGEMDRRFLRPEIDASRDEIAAMVCGLPPQSEAKLLDVVLRDRRDQQRNVSKVLRLEITDRSEKLVAAITRMQNVNADLVEISTQCRNARARLASTRDNYVLNGLRVPRLAMRRDNLRSTMQVLTAIHDLRAALRDLEEHKLAGRYREAINLARAPLSDLDAVGSIAVGAALLAQWRAAADPAALLASADAAWALCFNRAKSFNRAQYLGIIEAFVMLDARDRGVRRECEVVTQYMLGAIPRQVGQMALGRGSTSGANDGGVYALAAGVDPSTVLPCVVQTAAVTADTLILALQARNLHTEELARLSASDPNGRLSNPASRAASVDTGREMMTRSTSASHLATAALLSQQQPPGHSYSQSLGGASVASGSLPVTFGAAATVAAAGPSDAALIAYHQTALEHLKAQMQAAAVGMQRQVLEMAMGLRMQREDHLALHVFFVLSMTAECTSEIGPEAAAHLASSRDALKAMVSEWVLSNVIVPQAQLLLSGMREDTWRPDDTISRRQFLVVDPPLGPGDYRKEVRAVRDYVHKGSVDAQLNPFFDPRMSSVRNVADAITTREGQQDDARLVFVSATVPLGNLMFVLVCRVIARLPTQATQLCEWALDLLSLYLYTAAANMVGTDRTTPLEDHRDFDAATRAQLHDVRRAAIVLYERVMRASATTQRAGHARSASLGADGRPARVDLSDFPPLAIDGIRETYTQEAYMYSVAERLTAIEAVFPMIQLLQQAVVSVAPLLSPAKLDEAQQAIARILRCAEAILHVGCHRLTSACFPTEFIGDDVAALRWDTRVDASATPPWVARVQTQMKDFFGRWSALEINLPTPHLTTTFWRHFVQTVQAAAIGGFARRSRRLSEDAVAQMVVDAVNLHAALKATFGEQCFAMDHYMKNFLNAYFLDADGRLGWIRANHAAYNSDDLLGWFCRDSPHALKRDLLQQELEALSHEDAVYVDAFLAKDEAEAAAAKHAAG